MAARPRRSGISAALFAAMLALAATAGDASASARVCRQLEAELAGSGRAAAQAGRSDAALARQRAQLQTLKRQARASGCGFRLFGATSSSCDAIKSSISRVEGNIAAAGRKQSAGGGRSRAQIMAALRANGCRGDGAAASAAPRNLLEQIFGGGASRRETIEDVGPARRDVRPAVRRPDAGGAVAGATRFVAPPGRYRTLCVRTCDGYYYPLSTSSRPADFGRDQANCQTSCPGTATELYYARANAEADTMVSAISGRPYTALPSAYLYRQAGVEVPPACTCAAPQSFVAVGPATMETTQAITPSPLPPPPEDPVDTAAGDMEKAVAAPAERRVRAVGPVFLPDPEGAIDLRAPGLREAR